MAAQEATVAETHRDHTAKASKHQLLVVDLGKRQSRKQVKRLREGRGKLMSRIDEIVSDLVESGTVKGGVQPIVIVVREEENSWVPW
jgi:hypothetical protein